MYAVVMPKTPSVVATPVIVIPTAKTPSPVKVVANGVQRNITISPHITYSASKATSKPQTALNKVVQQQSVKLQDKTVSAVALRMAQIQSSNTPKTVGIIVTQTPIVQNAKSLQRDAQINASGVLAHKITPPVPVVSAGQSAMIQSAQATQMALMQRSSNAGGVGSALDNYSSSIQNGASAPFAAAKVQYQMVTAGFSNALGGIWNALSGAGSDVRNYIAPKITTVENKLRNIGSAIEKGASNIGSSALNDLKIAYQDSANAIQSGVNDIYNFIKTIPADLQKIGSMILSGLQSIWNDMVKFGTWLEQQIMNGIALLEQDFMKGMDWLWNNVQKDIGKFVTPYLEDIAIVIGGAALLYILAKHEVRHVEHRAIRSVA